MNTGDTIRYKQTIKLNARETRRNNETEKSARDTRRNNQTMKMNARDTRRIIKQKI